jgi:hypothetical protein
MTTISIREKTRKDLIRIAADLQKVRQERVDFDTVIQYLVSLHSRQQLDLDAWRLFTEPIPDLRFEDLYSDLMAERRRDDGRR